MMEANLYVFNVGHGAASLLQIEQDNKKYNILIDGGPGSDFKDKLKGLIGEEALDLVILTHIHRDHCNGLVDLFKDWKGEIRQLWLPYPIDVLQEIASALEKLPTKKLQELIIIFKNMEKNINENGNDRNDKDIKNWLDTVDIAEKNMKNTLEKLIIYICNDNSNSKNNKKFENYSERLKRLLDIAEQRLKNTLEKEIDIRNIDEDEFIILSPIISTKFYNSIYYNNRAIQKFVFIKTMASYKSLNNMLKNIRERTPPVPIVQATSGLLLKPSDFQLKISTLAPSYSILYDIKRSLKKQNGTPYDPGVLYMYCSLEAANVVGVATKISINNTTTILFPGDSDLQDVDFKDANADILLCPHHGGHVGNFIEKYEKTINQNNSVKKKIIIISKGKDGDRPSEEWTDFFQKHKKDIEVYCTNASEKVQKCSGCQPLNWQKENEVLHFSYKNKHWKLESKNNNQLCKFL